MIKCYEGKIGKGQSVGIRERTTLSSGAVGKTFLIIIFL